MAEESWRAVKGWELTYMVSNIGRVKSINRWCRESSPCRKGYRTVFRKGKMLTPNIGAWGYYSVTFSRRGYRVRSKGVKVHRLVAEAFIPNPHNYPQINHKNCIKTDNRVENLEWCTAKQNTRHSIKQGRFVYVKCGEKHPNAKLKNCEVEEIKRLFRLRGEKKSNIGCRYIAKMFKISKATALRIKHNVVWKHIKCPS